MAGVIAGETREFNVLVAATMSAGKSTLLNALLGQELLFSSNEPATALHTRIRHGSGASGVTGSSYNRVGRLLNSRTISDPAALHAWSTERGIKRIDLVGDFRTLVGGRVPISLHDMPGVNNSADARHAASASATLKNVPWDMLLYVLDAAYPGTTDGNALLKRVRSVAKRRSSGKVVFVLNKLDALDVERGESVAATVEAAQRWVRAHGFESSSVVPVMAGAGLAARLVMSDRPTSRRQKLQLRRAIADIEFQRDGLVQAAIIPAVVREDLAQQSKALLAYIPRPDAVLADGWDRDALQHIPIASGLRTLESLIDHHLEQACAA